MVVIVQYITVGDEEGSKETENFERVSKKLLLRCGIRMVDPYEF